jgi:hypothetical protein
MVVQPYNSSYAGSLSRRIKIPGQHRQKGRPYLKKIKAGDVVQMAEPLSGRALELRKLSKPKFKPQYH